MERTLQTNKSLPSAGNLRYELLQVRGRLAHLEPIAQTGDIQAIREVQQLSHLEQDLTEALDTLTTLRMAASGLVQLLQPVL